MTYLFLGPDYAAKEAKTAELKDKFLPVESRQFDFETLYAQKLDAETLKKALVALPAIAEQRLVVVKEFHKLSAQNKELILAFVENPGKCVLILDSDKIEGDEAFIKKLPRSVKAGVFGREDKLNVFDMTRAIGMQKKDEALKILWQLLSRGDQPLQLMGGVVWFWKNERNKLAADRFKKGLLALQEADLNIKRSRLKPEHALEVLIVKLCSPSPVNG